MVWLSALAAAMPLFAAAFAFAQVAPASDVAAGATPGSPLEVVIFSTPRCETCQQVKRLLPAAAERWGDRARIIVIEVTQPDDETLLARYERHYGLRDVTVPVVFVGDRAIEGGSQIVEALDAAIASQLGRGSTTYRPDGVLPRGETVSPPQATSHPSSRPTTQPTSRAQSQPVAQPTGPPPPAAGRLTIVLFSSPRCMGCKDVEDALPEILATRRAHVDVVVRDVTRMTGLEALLAYEQQCGGEELRVPVAFVGWRCIQGAREIIAGLGDAVDQELAASHDTWRPGAQQATGGSETASPVSTRVMDRFGRFNVGAVALAGLLDGVNPCAFTTIVFLISMLGYLGRSRHELAMVGVGFTTAVFVTYVALGLGLLGAVKALAVSHGLSRWVSVAVMVLAFALAAWSVIDYVRFRRSGGDFGKLKLGLPKRIRDRVHKVIREGLSSRRLVAGAFSVGFVVALLESVCTGQVYLPTIILLTRAPGLRTQAVAYLLLYNVMFILPLVGVLSLAYFGVGSQRLQGAVRNHIGALKLSMAVLFAGLGTLLLATL